MKDKKRPRALILRTAGTNCDWETQAAFQQAGGTAERVHINRLISGEIRLADYQILALPGGFSYGDDIASGRILANELRGKLGDQVRRFALSGRPVIGICNGFQVLVKMGLLPDPGALRQSVTLTYNDSGRFECRWVHLTVDRPAVGEPRCLWTRGLPARIELPVAHGEGKFVAGSAEAVAALERSGRIALRYAGPARRTAGYPYNPNGAVRDIAGICNDRGNVLGLMPHPERSVFVLQHAWRASGPDEQHGWGLKLFQNAVAACR